MSATTVLVPVSEPKARALLAGGAEAIGAMQGLADRAASLRSRVAAVDAIRDELHGLLFQGWLAERPRPPSRGLISALMAKMRPPEPPRLPTGYDPFIHLFGRSLPISSGSSREVATRLRALLAMNDDNFRTELETDLRHLGAGPEPLHGHSLQGISLGQAAEREVGALAGSDVRAAYDAIVRLSAWSRPVWRLDGEMLGPLLDMLGLSTKPESAAVLFAGHDRPLDALPEKLPGFSGGGGYIPSAHVKLLAGSLRLKASLVVRNAASNTDDPEVAMRHLRLLSEAVFFCEAEDLGLAEAAGVEWHDRKG